MSVFLIPARETFTGYSLGKQAAAWMESYLIFGPGDVRGEPYQLDLEKRGVLLRLYEVNPPGMRSPEGQSVEGRRRFKRGAVSVRKGWAKTELGAAICALELHPLAPARFHHWAEEGETSEDLGWFMADGEPYRFEKGEPVGIGVRDPYIPMVAYTEEQSEELAYGALKVMLSEGPLASDFDVGNERILVIVDGREAGKAVALATAPNSRDGARTTFQLFDETHRLVLPNHLAAHQTMQANIPKRRAADAWTLEVTTSFEPGLMSVAENTFEYARKVASGKVPDSRLFFYHRQASDKHQIYRADGTMDAQAMRAAVVEASGPAVEWTDVDAIVELGLDPQTDRSYWERVWLNRPIQAFGQVFDMNVVDQYVIEGWMPAKGEFVTLGFDGAQVNDSTALVVTSIITGNQALVACWENDGTKGWEVPQDEVDQAIYWCHSQWEVWRLYADPFWWETYVAKWQGDPKLRWRREPTVFPWTTNVHKRMALSIKAYTAGMRGGDWHYDGDPKFREHLGNARRYNIPILDEDGFNLYVMRKERHDSPFKIDIAMAGCLSWEAYRDAHAAGVKPRGSGRVPTSIF